LELLNSIVQYIVSFKAYVMLPIIIFAFSLIFRVKVGIALKSALVIGIGFIGIFIIFDFFVRAISPAVEALLQRTGLPMHALDVGWPPLASISWSFSAAPLMIIIYIAVNIALLLLKLTKVVNIDIWNFWHFTMVSVLVQAATHNLLLAIGAGIVASVIVIKIADWSAPRVNRYPGLSGVAISTMSAATYYPVGIIGNALLDRIPGVRKWYANPLTLRNKLGVLGEPMFIGVLMGVLLGIGAGYAFKQVLELAFLIAAVVYILPLMAKILGDGLMPVSDGMKAFISKHFPRIGQTYIGLDVAVLLGDPAVVVTGILLMPAALLLAFVLPGITFIPLGDLANTLVISSLIVVATGGNVIRAFIIGIPVIIGQLYIASYMAQVITPLAVNAGLDFSGYKGPVTSFLDGGLSLRFWIYKMFAGNWLALVLIPVIAGILILAWYLAKKDTDTL